MSTRHLRQPLLYCFTSDLTFRTIPVIVKQTMFFFNTQRYKTHTHNKRSAIFITYSIHSVCSRYHVLHTQYKRTTDQTTCRSPALNYCERCRVFIYLLQLALARRPLRLSSHQVGGKRGPRVICILFGLLKRLPTNTIPAGDRNVSA